MNLPFEGSLALRRRSSWEAADAGLLLWRENFVFFLPFFAVPFWLCAFGLCLLPESARVWSYLILWLLKPLFDRPLLHVISVRFFEHGAGMGRLCRGLGKSIRRGLAGDLLWRRFSPLRSAMMPLRVLEGRRRRIGERRRSLLKGGLGFCSLLTIWGMLLEITLLGGEILFCLTVAGILNINVTSLLNDYSETGAILLFAAWCVNCILVESLYVCMGFGLYLNSRVEVEGWDIEIMFRGFAETHKRKKNISAALVLALVFFLIPPVRGFAADESADRSGVTGNLFAANGADAPLETLRTILDSPDFGGERDGWGIRWKNPRQPKEKPGLDLSPWLEPVMRFFAAALRLLVIAFAAFLAVFLLFQLRKADRGRPAPRRRPVMKGLRNAGGESPEALLQKARAFFAQGDLRRAWGFCAAAAIGSWPAYRGLAFPPDATEYGCVELVRASGAGRHNEAEAFAALVNHWVSFAYGGQLPPEGSFEEALTFCESLGADNG
jgi:hypothetical protein